MALLERNPLLSEKRFDIEGRVVATQRLKTKSSRVRDLALICTAVLSLYLFGSTVRSLHAVRKPHLHASADPQSPSTGQETPHAVSNYSCLPGQACWPSEEQWSVFSQSLNGDLHLTVPWASSCYADPSSKQCQTVRKGYMDGVSRTSQYGAMEFLDWETCGQSHCYLDSMHPSSPTSGTCKLGRLSTYYCLLYTSPSPRDS